MAFVRSAVLGNYAEVARKAGLDPRLTLRAAGIDPASLADPELRVPIQAMARLLEDSVRRSGRESLGVEMAEGWRLADLGVVSLLLAHERSLRTALEAARRYRHLLGDSVSLSIEGSEALMLVRTEIVGGAATRSRQTHEFTLGVLLRVFRAILGPDWQPAAVHFAHAPPARLEAHLRFFGGELAFDRESYGIVCRSADLDRPNPARDAGLARHAMRLLDALPLATAPGAAAQDVLRAIHILMPMGRASVEQVARGMGLTARTLQRNLEAAEVTFSDLLNEARREVGPRYLGNAAYSLTQVGELLGFEFPSSFTRWFRAQYGCSPQQWRRERRPPRTPRA